MSRRRNQWRKADRESRESLDGPPLTTCKAWAIADAKTGKVLWGHQEADKLDIASTTKMMTAYIGLPIGQRRSQGADGHDNFFRIRRQNLGFTADVRVGERVTVGELLTAFCFPLATTRPRLLPSISIVGWPLQAE